MAGIGELKPRRINPSEVKPRLTMESSWFSCSVSRHLIIQSISKPPNEKRQRLRLSEKITLDASIDKAPASG